MKMFNLFKKKSDFVKQFEKELKEHEKKRKKLLKIKYKIPNKKELCSYIICYLKNDSSYMSNDYSYNYIKNHNRNFLISYVINFYNKQNESKEKYYYLSILYYYSTQEYIDLAIYYCELFMKDFKVYNGDIYYNLNNFNYNTLWKYQFHYFNYMLANLYNKNLNYDKALKYAFMSKEIENYNSSLDPYILISDILYHKGDYKNAIKNLNDGLNVTKDKYKKDNYLKIINEYNNKYKNNIYYKPRNIKRPRIDVKTKKLYDLTTGEIIE